jgi:predicted SAM-dependent methyltransferase
MLAKRREVSARYLAGEGIEVGALHYPLWVDPTKAHVRYVDRLTVADLRRHYPELASYDLVPVDVVDDGEKLETFPDASLDFIVGNHMLEHCENPLGTMRSHLRKVRPGGVLYYAVPDKRVSFDVDRPLTPFEHLVKDDQEGPAGSRVGHFREWSQLVNKQRGEDLEVNVRKLLDQNYSIHFHVWDARAWSDFLERARAYLQPSFTVQHLEQNDTEIITVLRRP